MTTTVIIPFRDRGIDMRRTANLDLVMAWWWFHGFTPKVVDDGGSGDEQFNRHRAYNKAVEEFPETDVFVFTEADMIIHPMQVNLAVQYAKDTPGLVVPFTDYRYLNDYTTAAIRDSYHDESTEFTSEAWSLPANHNGSMFGIPAESVKSGGTSIGAVNVVSRETLELTGGFTEITKGNWYDDRIIEKAFAFLTNPTRFVSGPAVHLYHLPGWTGDHLTEADKAATAHNKEVLLMMVGYIHHADREAVKSLMAVRRG